MLASLSSKSRDTIDCTFEVLTQRSVPASLPPPFPPFLFTVLISSSRFCAARELLLVHLNGWAHVSVSALTAWKQHKMWTNVQRMKRIVGASPSVCEFFTPRISVCCESIFCYALQAKSNIEQCTSSTSEKRAKAVRGHGQRAADEVNTLDLQLLQLAFSEVTNELTRTGTW